MSLKNNILSSFIAGLLSIALLFPSLVEFAHTVEGHEHVACDDVSTHIHEKNLDCSLCDFQFSTFQLVLVFPQDNIVPEIFSKPQARSTSADKSTNLHYFYLRGPPFIS